MKCQGVEIFWDDDFVSHDPDVVYIVNPLETMSEEQLRLLAALLVCCDGLRD